MTKAERTKLRLQSRLAAPAPWYDCGDFICTKSPLYEDPTLVLTKDSRREDVELIISMRNAIEELLDYVDRAEEGGG